MNFLHELKRRNVFKVAVVYAVVAWLLIQIIVAVLPTFNAPQWIVQTLIFIIMLGFPIALIIAWAFELTPEGIKPTTSVDPQQSITQQTGSKLNLAIITVLVLAVGYLVLENYVLPDSSSNAVVNDTTRDGANNSGDISEQAVTEKSIAVLPFVNLSNEPDQEYFSDGLSEEILNKLAQVDDLQVAARTSSFSFKNRNEDMRTIGEQLGVAYILEGSVRKAGEQLRITAQLILADSGFHLWSETYDRQLPDIFALQDEIALAVSTALQVTLGTGTFALPGNTRNVEAYQHFLKGMASRNAGGSTEEVLFLQNAVDELVLAVTQDPNFARAWILLWATYGGQIINASQERIPELARKREEAYTTAQTLAPEMPELQFAAATQLATLVDQERALLDMLSTKNNLQASVTARYANFLSNTGRIREALPYAEQAVRLNPADSMGYYNLGTILLIQGRLDEARRVLQKGTENLNGGQGGFLPVLGWKIAFLENGRQGWGERELSEIDPNSTNPTDLWSMRNGNWLIAQDPQQALADLNSYASDPSVPIVYQASFAGISAMLGDLDQAEYYLNLYGILDPWDNRHSELRKREGFKTWVRNNGLLDYWRASGNWSDFCRPIAGTEDDFECF